MYQKTKKQRRKWWRKLTPEQQNDFIESHVAKKAIKRKEKLRLKSNPKNLTCETCIHGITKSCTETEPCKLYRAVPIEV